jgi:hypothetical protein
MSIMHDSQGRGIDTNNPLPIKHSASDIIQPVEVQSRYAQTIQAFNAVSVAISGQSTQSSWIDCDGFNELAFTCLNDASTNSGVDVQWSNDGVAIHGVDRGSSSTEKFKTGNVSTKARYAKLALNNSDSALAHTMSAWIYLKA